MRKKDTIKTVTKKEHRCTICMKSGFSTAYKLRAHLFLHKAVPARYKCSFCPKEYFRSDEYSRHISTHLKTQKLFTCDHCGRSFVDKRNLIMHLNIHDDLPRRPENRFKCAACDANYCEERLLKYHTRKEHLSFCSKEPVHITKKLNDTWIEKVKDSKTYVEITKVKPNSLKIKKSKVRGIKDIKSDSGKTSFQLYIASVFASTDNHYSKAICDYCSKEMLKKSIIKHIRERHMKIRKFQCGVCDKKFNRHYQLCLHNCGMVGKRRRVKVKKEKNGM